MNHAEAAEVIKGSVSMKDVAGMFGYTVGGGGFMVCPFHGDHDASLKIYDTKGGHSGWHCFGCGRGGSVIDFVMENDGCNFQRAVRVINDGMGLGLLTVDNMFRQNAYRSAQRDYDRIREAMDAITDALEKYIDDEQCFLTKWLMYIEDKEVRERTADEWVRRELILEEMQYNDYLSEKVEEMRREVSEWRSRARSGKSP
jgi:hypothetical protein